jgi:hypothetical protein
MDVEGGDKLRTVLNSPSWYFNNPRWLKGVDPFVKEKLENARYQIKQFIGVPNDIEATLHSYTEKLADILYGRGFKKIPDWLLHDVRDPFAYMRSMVVHMKLGLFNPTAFFTQASTHLNIWGIAGPQHAAPGSIATLLHSWARVNQHPETLAALGKKAEAMGWRPGEWEEAFHELNLRGFTNIGHTHAFVDAPYQSKIVRTRLGNFLDWGHVFFREGAQSVRTAAWYTAYHEWRRGGTKGGWTEGIAHPTGKLSKQDWDRVLARAADLDHNMSRAGNSRIQAGIMSFPLQFQAYHLRLLELMTGKRLSPMEKAGLFGAQTIMYGIPIGGLGIGLPIVSPWFTDQINKHAQENFGYVPNDSFVNDVLMRGLPDAMLGQIFGEQYNIGERWGPGKFDVIDRLVEGNLSWWEAMTGATGSTFANLARSSSPLAEAGLAFITGHSEDFKLTGEDWLRPLEETSSISNLAGFIRTIETGRMMSKNQTYQSDVSKAKWRQAVLRYVVGLTPERITSSWSNHRWTAAEDDDYKSREKEIIPLIHRMLDARNNNDPSAAQDMEKRIMSVAGDMPENWRQRIWNQGIRSYNKPMDASTAEQRFLHMPKGKEAVGKEILKKLQLQRE